MWAMRLIGLVCALCCGCVLWRGFEKGRMTAIIWGGLPSADRQSNALGFWIRTAYNSFLLAMGAFVLFAPAA